MGASPEGRRQKLLPRCKRGFLSTASSKLELPSPGSLWVLTGPWHGPMPPRTVLSLPTTCRRFHRPRPPTGIFRPNSSTLGSAFLVLPGEAWRNTVPCGRSWLSGAVPSQRRHKCCVNGQLGPVEQTEPVHNRLESPTSTDGTDLHDHDVG